MIAERFDKILVIGAPGLGKTRFSHRLGKLTGRKITHLDKHLWGPNWRGISNKKQLRRRKIEDLTSSDQWILDGHYLDEIERRIEKADTIVLFDMPVWKSYYGVYKRWIFNNDNIGDQHPEKENKVNRALRRTIRNYNLKYTYDLLYNSENKNIFIINNYRNSNKILNYMSNKINNVYVINNKDSLFNWY